jgi:hypothetical protein
MGAQKKVKKSNESINARLALVMKSGDLVAVIAGQYCESCPVLDRIRIRPRNSDYTGSGSYLIKYNGPFHYYICDAA